MEVVPENAVPVLRKEQVDSKAKKADRRRRSVGGARGSRNEWSDGYGGWSGGTVVIGIQNPSAINNRIREIPIMNP